MDKFIESLSFEQISALKIVVDKQFEVMKMCNKQSILDNYRNWSEKELKRERKICERKLDFIKNNREFDMWELHIDCINELLAKK